MISFTLQFAHHNPGGCSPLPDPGSSEAEADLEEQRSSPSPEAFLQLTGLESHLFHCSKYEQDGVLRSWPLLRQKVMEDILLAASKRKTHTP